MNSNAYAIGVDFGTESGRALLLDLSSGEELATSVVRYPHGAVDRTLPRTGERLPADWALQVPDDWVKVIETALPDVLGQAGVPAAEVVGIGVDFTSCTMLPVDREGTPLCNFEQCCRQSCTAGYKAMWSESEGLPSSEYFEAAYPGFSRPGEKLGEKFAPLGTRAGTLRPEVAKAVGLPESVAVAVGNVDSFVSVPGAGVEQPGRYVTVVGTSICDMLVNPEEIRLPGITGVVKDGILPGLYGYEAGQEHGLEVTEIVACGGIAERSPLTMQLFADTAGLPVHMPASGEIPARGAALFGAVAAGVFPDIGAAVAATRPGIARTYAPEQGATAVYDRVYAIYRSLYDLLGRTQADLLDGLKLIAAESSAT